MDADVGAWGIQWSTADPSAAAVLAQLTPQKKLSSVAFTRLDGRAVLVTAGDKSVRLWDVGSGQPIGKGMTGHTAWVASLAVADLGGRPVAVTGSLDGTARLWDLTSRKKLGQPLEGHHGCVNAVALTEVDGQPVVVTGDSDAVRI